MNASPSVPAGVRSPSAPRRPGRWRRLAAWFIVFAVLPLTATTCPLPRGLVVAPYLQRVGTHEATLLWETRHPGDSRVDFGPTAELGLTARVDEWAAIHEVRLTGLAPDSEVYYRVSSRTPLGEVESEILSFRTAPEDDRPFSFALVGDTQDQPEVWRRVARRIFAERPSFLVHAGDIVGHGPVKDEWTEEFFEPAGAMFSHLPFFAVIGNHEQDAGWFYRYLANPDPEYHYSFRWSSVEFFMLDTNRPIGPETPQYRWLDGALAASTARWKIACHHHPVWTSDDDDYGDTHRHPVPPGDPDARALIPLYEKHGVDLVFYGHVHGYERSRPIRGDHVDEDHGVVYLQSGGGGGRLDRVATSRRWHAAKIRCDHHFVMLDVQRDRIEIRAHDIEGRLFDQTSIEKAPPLARD
ncbi:MAG: metallophosphoesterase family protein [Planctomycetota bacterium]